MIPTGNDRWVGRFPLSRIGRYYFTVLAWKDRFANFVEELEKKHVELSWNFLETLSEVFHLPASLVSSGALALRATDGKVKATETALGFAVRYETTVLPRADVVSAPASPPSASEAPPAPMASEPPSGSLRPYGASSTEARAFVFGGAVGALAFMTLGAFARMVRRRR